jgi:methyl-accepting chemotaxis protein
MKFGTRLAFIFILIGFLPLLFGGFFIFYFFDGYLKEIAYDNLEKITEITSLKIENFIDHSIASSVLLTRNDKLITKDFSPEEAQDELEKIYDYYQILFQDITLLDNNGKVIASTSERSYGRWEVNPWFIKAKNTKEVVVSDMYAVFSPEEPIIAIFIPNIDEEEEIFSFIVIQINTEPLFRDLDFKIGKGGIAILLNSQGDIIFHPQREKLFEKMTDNYPLEKNALIKKGSLIFEMEGESFVASFEVIEKDLFDMGWQLVIMQPEEEAFGFLKKMAINYLFLTTILLFPIILLSFFISKKIIKPLKNLSITAKRVARGDFRAKALAYSKDEFGELAENFNKMTKDLERAKQTMEEEKDVLEIKVNARTKELNEINEKLEEKVAERTGEIKRKLNEFEKMSKLMAGRELKMIELKKALKEAEEEIERLKSKDNI